MSDHVGGEVTSQRGSAATWQQLLGPVGTPQVVVALLGVSRRTLDGARSRGEVLGVRTAGGRWVYPLQQFRRDGVGRVSVVEGLDEVLAALCSQGDAAGAARWLATPNRRLDGETPWHALLEGDRSDAVAQAARAQAQAWAGR